jgi:hypothetical protein
MEHTQWVISTMVTWDTESGLLGSLRSAHLLENGNGERGGLASTRLGLRNDVVPLYDGDNGSLLDGRRALETGFLSAPCSLAIADLENHSPVGIDTTEELRLEFHIVEAGWEDEISGHVGRRY